MKTTALPKYISLGRISELQERPDANLIAIKTPEFLFGDYRVKRYGSRLALEAFLKNPGKWAAIIYTPVHRNLMCYPAFEKAQS